MNDAELFERALAIPDATGRAAFLARACAGDAARLERLERLLARHGHWPAVAQPPRRRHRHARCYAAGLALACRLASAHALPLRLRVRVRHRHRVPVAKCHVGAVSGRGCG